MAAMEKLPEIDTYISSEGGHTWFQEMERSNIHLALRLPFRTQEDISDTMGRERIRQNEKGNPRNPNISH
jgi:hypothetical protein